MPNKKTHHLNTITSFPPHFHVPLNCISMQIGQPCLGKPPLLKTQVQTVAVSVCFTNGFVKKKKKKKKKKDFSEEPALKVNLKETSI